MTSVAERTSAGGDQEVEVDESTVRPRKRFESSLVPAPELEVVEETPKKQSPWTRLVTSRRYTTIVSAGLLVAALGGFIGAAQISSAKGSAEVSATDTQRIFELQSQIQSTRAKTSGLPDARTGERSLVTALQASNDVAALQNDYRILAGKVDEDGRLAGEETFAGSRGLSPYFVQSIDEKVLQPWYLLSSDATVPVGTGLAQDFRSGFTWVAQVPHGIDESGRVNVTWLALQTSPPAGQSPQVLAWAQADYDIVRRVFLDVRFGTSVQGEQQRLQVVTG